MGLQQYLLYSLISGSEIFFSIGFLFETFPGDNYNAFFDVPANEEQAVEPHLAETNIIPTNNKASLSPKPIGNASNEGNWPTVSLGNLL